MELVIYLLYPPDKCLVLWVTCQREQLRHASVDDNEQQQRLESIGFVWQIINDEAAATTTTMPVSSWDECTSDS